MRCGSVFGGEDAVVRLPAPAFSLGDAPPRPDNDRGTTLRVAFEEVRRLDVRVGDLVLVRNQDMLPADLVLLATGNAGGAAYVETSSIDGETNLKLKTSPAGLYAVPGPAPMELDGIPEEEEGVEGGRKSGDPEAETLKEALHRVVAMSALAYPDGRSALDNPANVYEEQATASEEPELVEHTDGWGQDRRLSVASRLISRARMSITASTLTTISQQNNPHYVAALTSELPNASVSTYSGRLTLPPLPGTPAKPGLQAGTVVPLSADNLMLRGAFLRNTDWAIGLACFTGPDTKLARNSFRTPSKFSQLDTVVNNVVKFIILTYLLLVLMLAGLSVSAYRDNFDGLWYVGFNDMESKWPYLPEGLDAPIWRTATPNFGQQVSLVASRLWSWLCSF